jgi:hypothetical protein
MRHGQLVRKTSSVRKGKGPAFNRTSKVFPNPQLLEQPSWSRSPSCFH